MGAEQEDDPEPEIHVQPVFPPARADLRPDLLFIVEKVRFCLDDFVRRERYECEGEVGNVVAEIGDLVKEVEEAVTVVDSEEVEEA